MNGMSLGDMGALLAVCTSVCSLASFYIGRQRAVSEEAEKEGHLTADLQYIKDYIRDTTKSLDALTIKLESQNKQREEDYRGLLVKLTEVQASYKSLHIRVDNIEKLISKFHQM